MEGFSEKLGMGCIGEDGYEFRAADEAGYLLVFFLAPNEFPGCAQRGSPWEISSSFQPC